MPQIPCQRDSGDANARPPTHSPKKEWQPAEDEGAHDDAQRACGLVLPLHFD